MKNIKKALAFLLLFTLVGSICFAAPKKKDPLDAAIRETSDYLNSNVAKGSKIVILNIQSESGALSEYIIDELISNAVNDRIFLVVDRQQLDAIRAEQNFQFSGEVDDKQALEIGKFFGAQTIVSGALGLIGKDYRLRVRALEVQTALVQGQFNKNITKSTLIPTLLASKPSGTTTATTASARQTSTTTTASKGATSGGTGLTIVNNTGITITTAGYWVKDTVGNIQPLDIGGNISNNQTKKINLPKFEANRVYTLGFLTSDGAQYNVTDITFSPGMTVTITTTDLSHAAPVAYKIGDTGPGGGIIFYDKGDDAEGWRYLEAAPPEFEYETNWNSAMEMSKLLNINGITNWRLPSRDELGYMYLNLKKKGLGGFSDET